MNKKIIIIISFIALCLSGCSNIKGEEMPNIYTFAKEDTLFIIRGDAAEKEQKKLERLEKIKTEHPYLYKPSDDIINSTFSDCKIQVGDMVFLLDYTMTEDDVKNVVKNSVLPLKTKYEDNYGDERLICYDVDDNELLYFIWGMTGLKDDGSRGYLSNRYEDDSLVSNKTNVLVNISWNIDNLKKYGFDESNIYYSYGIPFSGKNITKNDIMKCLSYESFKYMKENPKYYNVPGYLEERDDNEFDIIINLQSTCRIGEYNGKIQTYRIRFTTDNDDNIISTSNYDATILGAQTQSFSKS